MTLSVQFEAYSLPKGGEKYQQYRSKSVLVLLARVLSFPVMREGVAKGPFVLIT
jgi:hypothetical protein